eukprot:TRINITY_DN2137_c0_g1_i1.p1 TRINITY_DN2137_c0_g1~~TRINITY_DN2137_c0_g1_i1.p1  ORF type:complete len:462 (-),score=127.55 TRINITY_DN2137_c0_g1_i1:94-1479(-)
MSAMNANRREHVVCVVGAGLGGVMAALYLARRSLNVRLIESRPDIRLKRSDDGKNEVAWGQFTDASKRSINLALSYRGIYALQQNGLFDAVKPYLIPMKGRLVHDLNGSTNLVPYGLGDQAIYSISRNFLNSLILEELLKHPNVEVLFNTKCKEVDEEGNVTVEQGGKLSKFPTQVVIGADGAFSEVRRWLMRRARVDYSQEFLSLAYKEIAIPPNAQGDFAISPDYLHIWPYKELMTIALANPDKTFTGTLYLPWTGEDSVESLKTDAQILEFYRTKFPELIPLVPDLVQQFHTNPASPLLTIRCKPWHYSDRIVIMGDAAHAACPFYGQGMNCAFEDAAALDELYGLHHGDWGKVLSEFSRIRQPAGEALGLLSLNNLKEMRDRSAMGFYRWKKRVELALHKMFPSLWMPLYSMVTFSRVPYDYALKKSIKQDRIFFSVLAILALIVLLILKRILKFLF